MVSDVFAVVVGWMSVAEIVVLRKTGVRSKSVHLKSQQTLWSTSQFTVLNTHTIYTNTRTRTSGFMKPSKINLNRQTTNYCALICGQTGRRYNTKTRPTSLVNRKLKRYAEHFAHYDYGCKLGFISHTCSASYKFVGRFILYRPRNS